MRCVAFLKRIVFYTDAYKAHKYLSTCFTFKLFYCSHLMVCDIIFLVTRYNFPYNSIKSMYPIDKRSTDFNKLAPHSVIIIKRVFLCLGWLIWTFGFQNLIEPIKCFLFEKMIKYIPWVWKKNIENFGKNHIKMFTLSSSIRLIPSFKIISKILVYL